MDMQVEAGQMDMVDGGVDTVDSVVNSAANNLLPKQISSSLSSGLSVGSVKVFSKFLYLQTFKLKTYQNRRPNAASGLTLVRAPVVTSDSLASGTPSTPEEGNQVPHFYFHDILLHKFKTFLFRLRGWV